MEVEVEVEIGVDAEWGKMEGQRLGSRLVGRRRKGGWRQGGGPYLRRKTCVKGMGGEGRRWIGVVLK